MVRLRHPPAQLVCGGGGGEQSVVLQCDVHQLHTYIVAVCHPWCTQTHFNPICSTKPPTNTPTHQHTCSTDPIRTHVQGARIHTRAHTDAQGRVEQAEAEARGSCASFPKHWGCGVRGAEYVIGVGTYPFRRCGFNSEDWGISASSSWVSSTT